MTVSQPLHKPVMCDEVLQYLGSNDLEVFFDGTLGLGGHAQAVLESFPNLKYYVGCDLDQQHLELATKRLDGWKEKLVLVNRNFSDMALVLQEHGVRGKMSILLDLGVCSNHFDDGGKGFSFQAEGPLNFAFDDRQSGASQALINEASLQELRTIMREYGEEPAAHRLAQKIIESRAHASLTKTSDLREIVEKNVHPRDRRKALMRVFQAFRIAVNDELGHLEKVLVEGLSVMESGDRIGIMSYHSLEDRIVKQFFKKASRPVTRETTLSLHEEVSPAKLKMITKKALEASDEEVAQNPRSRSAKFRIAQKI